MTSQVSLFDNQESKTSQSYRGGSLASLTAMLESIWLLMMSVTCGPNTGGSFARLCPDGLWEKMFQDSLQVSLDGSSEEYCETWPRWGLMLDGVAYGHLGLEPSINENGYSLLPTPVTSMYKGVPRKRHIGSTEYRRSFTQEALRTCEQDPIYINPDYAEVIMGFTVGWTELKPLETA